MAEELNEPYVDPGPPDGEGFSLAGAVGSIATMMVAITATSQLLRFGSRNAAAFLTKRFSNIAGESVEAIAANYVKTRAPQITESVLARQLRSGERAYTAWSNHWADMDKIYNSTSYAASGMRHGISDVTKATDYHFTRMRARTTDFLTRPGFQNRAIGLGVKTSRVIMEGNAAAYIADQALNVFNRRDQPDGPSWYNLPGHALNFAKFTVQNTPLALAWGGGAKFAAKIGAEAGVAGLRSLVQTFATKPVVERALERTGQAAEWIYDALGGIEAGMRGAVIRGNGAINQSMGALSVFKTATNPLNYWRVGKAYYKGATEGWNKFHAYKKQAPPQAFSNETVGLLATAAQVTDKGQREMFLRDYYTRTQSNRQSAFGYIFGLKKNINFQKQMAVAEQQAIARLRLNKEEDVAVFRSAWKDTAAFLHRNRVQVEEGFYKGTKGRVIDLRAMMPKRLLNETAEALDRFGFRIPGQSLFGLEGRIKPAQFFMIPDLLRRRNFERFDKGSVFLGKNITAEARGVSGLLHGPGALIDEGIYTVPRDATGVFAGGGFYHLANGQIRRLHSPRMTHKLFSKGAWSLMTDTMAWMSGHYPMRRQIEDQMVDPDRPLIRRLMDKLDLGMTTSESVFSRIGSMINKFTWSDKGGNKHPWKIYQSISAAATSSKNAGHASDVVDAFDELLMSNIREGSHLRNKAIREAVIAPKLFEQLQDNPNDYRLLVDTARDIWEGGSGAPNPFVKRMGYEWNLPKIFEMTQGIQDYQQLGRMMTDTVATSNRDVHNSLFDFITLHHMTRNSQNQQILGRIGRLSERLMNRGDITDLEASSLRVTAAGLAYPEKDRLLKEFFEEKDGGAPGLQNLMGFLKTSSTRKDIETVSQHLYRNPLRNFLTLEDTPYVSQHTTYDPVRKDFRSAPFTAVPWKASGRMSQKELVAAGLEGQLDDPTPRSMDGLPVTKGGVIWAALMRRTTRLFEPFGLGLNPGNYTGTGIWQKLGGPGTQMLMQGVMLRRVGAIAAAALTYQTVDHVLDIFPGLGQTPLGEGLTVGLADQAVKARMGLGYLADATGITSASQYLEGLFPGMIDSPLMRVARGVVLPIWAANKIGFTAGRAGKSMASGLLAGLAIGGAQGFGLLDMTKNTQELKDIYSGREEVPIRRGRWWEMSSSNYEGGRIRNFQPNWYASLKAQHMSTPEGWGSPLEQMLYKPWPLLDFNPIGFVLGGRYHYAKQHYYSRPYPLTNTAFAEMPIIGPTVAATLGRIIAPPKPMHDDVLFGQLDRYGYSTSGGHTQARGFIPGTSELARSFPVSPYGIRQTVSQQLYNVQQWSGLWGFGLQTATSMVGGFEQPFENDNVLQTAGEITSMRRQYYDKELGGLLGNTELWRRFIPKRRTSLNHVNPLQNRMPKWLPVQFRLGDAYAQTPAGELLLPGQGYSAAHNVNMTFPVSADVLGLPLEDTVRRMLSLGRPDPIGAEEIERANARIKAAAEVYEPYNDVSGTHDGIIRKGRRRILQKVKNLSSQELTDLVGPTETDISEVNFYLRMAGVAEGVLQYRVEGVPILAFPVQYSEQRFQKDMAIVNQARRKAADLYAQGVGFEGSGYSHMDRAHVLANVAPWSNEFKQEIAMAKAEVRVGRGDAAQLEKIKQQRDAIMRSQDFYPRRFLGKIMTPDVTYNNLSLNKHIKAAAEYSTPERALGALWEGFNSLNHPFDRFHSYKTPLESYKATMLYGRNIKMWQHPFEHWADAYSRGFMSKDDPMSGYLAGFLGGYTMGPTGLGSSLVGGVVSAAYGTVHGLYRKVRGGAYIPGSVQEIREVNRYFDSMSYHKNMMLYDMTGNTEYLETARSTMAGLVPSDLSRQSWSHMYRATGYQERPYVMSFVKETDPSERQEILQHVPEDLGQVLQAKWAKMDGLASDIKLSKVPLERLPAPDWAGWSPDVDLDDVELRTVENMGFDAHDFGLGWSEQQRRIRNSPHIPGPLNIRDSSSTGGDGGNPMLDQSQVRLSLERILADFGVEGFVTVAPSYHDNVLSLVI